MSLDRRTILITGAAAALCGMAKGEPAIPGLRAPLPEPLIPTGARRALYERSLVIDALASPSSTNVPEPPEGPPTPAMVQNARDSGITAINLTVSDGDLEQSLAAMDMWDRVIASHHDLFTGIRTHADLLRAKREGKFGFIYGFQSPRPVGTDLDRLDLLAGRGVRFFQLAYNSRSAFGDGCLVAENRGITPLGREAVARLNSLGVILDMSHSAPRTAIEAIEASTEIPVISHTGCRAVYDHPRSMPDDALRACAAKGGVVGIYLMPFMGLDPDYPSRNLLVRHIEHALNICGEDHVGIGSDLSTTPVEVTQRYMKMNLEDVADRRARGVAAPLEEVPVLTPDLNSPRRMELIAEAMAERGHSDRVIEKLLGANFARVFEAVWKS